jgi:hypothetical protein
MTSLDSAAQVLKTDTRGRVHTPRERQATLLAEFARSGLSGAAFARLVGVKYSTLMGWLGRQRRQAPMEVASPPESSAELAPAAPPPLRLFEAVLEPARRGASQAVVVELPGGARLLLGEASQVLLAAELLGALAQQGGRSC